ncbi:hypothetical protein QCB44_00820 [Thiomicrorhabdus sp. zzn3]|uniref:hypothetical protein n=1 Tax=Thiomicrorhabdus sp. zzn3 TaxID=3039775 RepID=UPI0024369933|nr:hypothetical protein [Thiomicrorhabdus sp. zzn3]MDG6777238.1 hypothetical protein [Thiomicrorhabdus sp. zzn3]
MQSKFSHFSALKHLLELDTTVFKPELYYPWFIQANAIKGISFAVISSTLLIGFLLLFFSNWPTLQIGLLTLAALLLFGLIYYTIILKYKNLAQSQALKQIMKLEKKEFMKHLEPFVVDDQKAIAQRIAKDVDFTTKEYTSVTLATQSRVLEHTDEFIKDIERMAEDEEAPKLELDFTAFSESEFRVPPQAKANYEKLKNFSTFNERLIVPPEAKAAILIKVKEAMNRAALGRHG